MSDITTEKIYNDNASKWLRLSPSSLSDFTARPHVFDACGNLAGRSILDLGCGEGYCARELKKRGAGDYLGIDLSSEMIAAAQVQEQQDQYGIEYVCTNVVEYTPQRQFDLCVAVFLFNYLKIQEMQQVFEMVYAALSHEGQFVFSVPHPFFPFLNQKHAKPFYFDSTGVNYFFNVDERLEGQIWKRSGEPLHVQCVHKTFADYLNCLKQAGFTALPDIQELTVTPSLAKTDSAFFSPLIGQPLHLLFSIRK